MTDTSFLIALFIMTLAVFATRIAGALIMMWVTPTPRVERFLEGLSVSVIAALVASQLVTAELRNTAAVAVAIGIMLLTRSSVGAMFAGMIAAAVFPLVFSF